MKKNMDSRNRFRGKIISFRMSLEEAELLDRCAQLSGLTKQDYLINRALKKEITVTGNPRVFKALRNQISYVFDELTKLERVSEHQSELLELMHYIATIIHGLKGELND